MRQLWIPGKLPGLNELINARGKGRDPSASRWDGYNEMKRFWTEQITLRVRQQQFGCSDGGIFTYLFVEPDQRRDPSNVYGFIKILEDALIAADVLANDGWDCVKMIRPFHTKRVSGERGVLLIVSSGLEPTRLQLELCLQENPFRKP